MTLRNELILSHSDRWAWSWLWVSLLGGAVQGGVSAALWAGFCQSLPLPLVGLVQGFGWASYGLVTSLWLIRYGSRLGSDLP
ncbi:MAG: hypothetical protein WBB18_05410 [Nodosilinea sp.]